MILEDISGLSNLFWVWTTLGSRVLTRDRKIAASREQQRKDRDREDLENGYPGTADDYEDDEMDM